MSTSYIENIKDIYEELSEINVAKDKYRQNRIADLKNKKSNTAAKPYDLEANLNHKKVAD